MGPGGVALGSTLSGTVAVAGRLVTAAAGVVGTAAAGGGTGRAMGSPRAGSPSGPRGSWFWFSICGRSGILSALGPVGGTVDRPAGMLGLGALGADGGAGVGTTVLVADTGGAGLKECAGAVDFASKAGFLHTLDPNAGTAAGGEDARGAYLSLEASARLAIKSFLSDSRRASFALSGSVATEERREYESSGAPNRSPVGWCAEWGVEGPVGVPGMCRESTGPLLR